jgi:hypothetical protein
MPTPTTNKKTKQKHLLLSLLRYKKENDQKKACKACSQKNNSKLENKNLKQRCEKVHDMTMSFVCSALSL